MKEEDVEVIVEKSIFQLIQEYNRGESMCLTENDAVCRLYSLLTRNCAWEEIEVHSELRPFYADVGKSFVIVKKNGKIGWNRQKRSNSGDRVDLALIDGGGEAFKEALEKAKKDQRSGALRYWRVLSYPVSAFRAAIEVEIRVQGNNTSILEDMDKLTLIRDRNPRCKLCLVVLDRNAEERILRELVKKSAELLVRFYKVGKAGY